MLCSSNVEPRRNWRKAKYQDYWTSADRFYGEGCLSCGQPVAGQHFCGSCVEWTRQSNLDENWDDIGEAG
jgi:hypothetical protein